MQGTLAFPRQRGIDTIANKGVGEQIALTVGPQQMPLNHGTVVTVGRPENNLQITRRESLAEHRRRLQNLALGRG